MAIKYHVWRGDGQQVPPLWPTGSTWDVWEGSEEMILLQIQVSPLAYINFSYWYYQ